MYLSIDPSIDLSIFLALSLSLSLLSIYLSVSLSLYLSLSFARVAGMRWWDHQMPWQSFFTVCEMVAPQIDLAFIGVLREGRVLYHCCSNECESPPLLKEPAVTDVEALLSLVAEVAEELPDMVFLFNTGDQPFADKVYWSPIPQFHWVRSAGHWTIPLPNPYHLRAHAQNLLGDFPQHRDHHMPWAKKIPKVYWRGQLSAPDHFLQEDLGTLLGSC